MTLINVAPDTDFLHEIMDSQGKKQLSPFIINRLNLAVKALSRTDAALGASAEADVLTYANNYQEALRLLTKYIVKYGYTPEFLDSQLRAASYAGDWHISENIWENYLAKYKFDNLPNKLKIRYLEFLSLYAIPNNFDELTQTSKRLEQLNDLGISLETYRKFMDTVLAEYGRSFNGGIQFCFNFREDDLLLILFNKYWSDDETLEITQNINDAILKVNDVKFQLEVDLIQLIAINFNPEKFPRDFDIYDYESEDEELFKMISARKSQYSSDFETIEMEALYV